MDEIINTPSSKEIKRRIFLKYMGVGVVVATMSFVGHKEKYHDLIVPNKSVCFGVGDIGLLNYAYSIEQLQVAFYIKAIDESFSWMSPLEESYFKAIRNQEILHCEFFRDILAENAISELEMDFSAIDFSNRKRVLNAAKTIKDLTVSVYHDIGRMIDNMDYLFAVGNIVSVEAKHGAWIGDLISNGDLLHSSVVDNDNVEPLRSSAEVADMIAKYIKTKLNIPYIKQS